PTEASVSIFDRKRTSCGTAGMAASPVAHERVVDCPGTSVASIMECPFSDFRLVMRPEVIVTYVRSPGTVSVSCAAPADGTGMLKEARPVAMFIGNPDSTTTENSPGPGSRAV